MYRSKRKAGGVNLKIWGSQGLDSEDEELLPSQKLSITSAAKRREEVEQDRAREFEKLPPLTQAALQDLYPASAHLDHEAELGNLGGENTEIDGEWEDEEVIQHEWSDPGIKRTHRSWASRTHSASAAWDNQFEQLADAYIQYYNSTKSEGDMPSAPVDPASGTGDSFQVKAIDLFSQTLINVPHDPNDFENTSLIKLGYLSPSPVHPKIAVSLRTLEFFRNSRRRLPRYSVQVFAKVLCDQHCVPYQRYLRDQLSAALDVYFIVLQTVESRIQQELGRNHSDWRHQNACPCCTYKLEGEIPMRYSMLVCADGNSSLKRFKRVGEDDPRSFNSTYFLSSEFVNEYQNEVRTTSTQGPAKKKQRTNETEDGLQEASPCAPRWKNARNDQSKRSFDALDETGIFTVLCRHGMMLLAVDMIQSGERAKYPLACLSEIIRIHGDNVLWGYDIGCQFSTTANNSPKLGATVRRAKTGFIVGSFHGWAHDRMCQLQWHPLWRDGAGMEDFEGNERFYSHSNGVAASTQHASRYNRHQQIHQHIEVSDEDRLLRMGIFLYNNFTAAINQLETSLHHKETAKKVLKILDQEFYDNIEAEKLYLKSLLTEPPEDVLAIDYITAREALRGAEQELANVSEHLRRSYANKPLPVGIEVIEGTFRRGIEGRIQVHLRAVQDFELQLRIEAPWDPDSPEWRQASDRRANRELYKAYEELEALSVARRFELEKYNHEGTGYNLREQIEKNLASRSKSLQNLIDRVNKLAVAANPRREKLTAAEVGAITNGADFALLKESRHEVLSQSWAKKPNRDATQHAMRVERAREELIRVQIEVQRLRVWMQDEVHHLSVTRDRLRSENSALWPQLQLRLDYRLRVNSVIESSLQKIERHSFYNKSFKTPRLRVGHANILGFSYQTEVTENVGLVTLDLDDLQDDDDDDDVINYVAAVEKVAEAASA